MRRRLNLLDRFPDHDAWVAGLNLTLQLKGICINSPSLPRMKEEAADPIAILDVGVVSLTQKLCYATEAEERQADLHADVGLYDNISEVEKPSGHGV